MRVPQRSRERPALQPLRQRPSKVAAPRQARDDRFQHSALGNDAERVDSSRAGASVDIARKSADRSGARMAHIHQGVEHLTAHHPSRAEPRKVEQQRSAFKRGPLFADHIRQERACVAVVCSGDVRDTGFSELRPADTAEQDI